MIKNTLYRKLRLIFTHFKVRSLNLHMKNSRCFRRSKITVFRSDFVRGPVAVLDTSSVVNDLVRYLFFFCAGTDVDECASSPCKTECINLPGSYRCSCDEGYEDGPDGTCVGKNEYLFSVLSIMEDLFTKNTVAAAAIDAIYDAYLTFGYV